MKWNSCSLLSKRHTIFFRLPALIVLIMAGSFVLRAQADSTALRKDSLPPMPPILSTQELPVSVIVATKRTPEFLEHGTTLVVQHTVGADISQSLKTLPNIRLLQAGAVLKPVIQGATGARVSIVDGALELGSQLWGLDHAPELDARRAERLEVIHGARAVWYAAASGGSLVRLAPLRPDSTDHWSGHLNLGGRWNGREGFGDFRLSRGTRTIGAQVMGSYRNSGDLQTPDYYLRNTGAQTGSLAGDLFFRPNDRWEVTAEVTGYRTLLAVLRGSHIGNLTDLESALEQDVPFFTEPDFSRDIDNPFQDVTHLAGTATVSHSFQKSAHRVVVGIQEDDRKEFDVRRGNRDSIPALSLALQTRDVRLENRWKNFRMVWQYRKRENRNNPETGVAPLIPDFIERSGRWSAIWTPNFGFRNWTFGAQVFGAQLKAWPLTITLPRAFDRQVRERFSAKLAADHVYVLDRFELASALLVESRAPEPHEWYSNGLHQGVSGIERGDHDLGNEHTFKATFTPAYSPKRHWQLRGEVFAQYTVGYIQLLPTGRTSLTTRGAFPVFEYRQSNVWLSGGEVFLRWFPNRKGLIVFASGSGMAGVDENGIGLPFLAPPELRLGATQRFMKDELLDDGSMLHRVRARATASVRYVGQQQQATVADDFAAPPQGYALADLHFMWAPKLTPKHEWVVTLDVENAFNTPYRAYLSRLRYFADDPGRQVRLAVEWRF